MVIDRINDELSGGWLEGAPFQWIAGKVSVRGRDGDLLQGWCCYVPSVYFVAEDRFGASSWLDWWVSDASLHATAFCCPALDPLARSWRSVPAALGDLMRWASDLTGEDGGDALEYAMDIWANEELVRQRRLSTGRHWPVGREVHEWLTASSWSVLGHEEHAASFVEDFCSALRRRCEQLN